MKNSSEIVIDARTDIPTLVINSGNFDVSIRFIERTNGKYGVRIGNCDTDMLTLFISIASNTKVISHIDASMTTLSADMFYSVSDISELITSVESEHIDFRFFKKLRLLSLPWPKTCANIEQMTGLEQLCIQKSFTKYKWRISQLNALSSLKKFMISDTILTSLDGTEALENVTFLRALRCSKLACIGAISNTNISDLEIWNSNNIKYDCIDLNDKLVGLAIYNCKLHDLEFLRNMPLLHRLHIINTIIINNNLLPIKGLINSRLNDVVISPDRPRYIPRVSRILEMIELAWPGERFRRESIEMNENTRINILSRELSREANRQVRK